MPVAAGFSLRRPQAEACGYGKLFLADRLNANTLPDRKVGKGVGIYRPTAGEIDLLCDDTICYFDTLDRRSQLRPSWPSPT